MIFVSRLLDTDFTIVVEGEDSSKAFRELVHRATNLWPDAPAEIKAFADKITNHAWMEEAGLGNGALQDYSRQDTSKTAPRCKHYNSIAVPEKGSGFLRCLDCGHERDVKHPYVPYQGGTTR